MCSFNWIQVQVLDWPKNEFEKSLFLFNQVAKRVFFWKTNKKGLLKWEKRRKKIKMMWGLLFQCDQKRKSQLIFLCWCWCWCYECRVSHMKAIFSNYQNATSWYLQQSLLLSAYKRFSWISEQVTKLKLAADFSKLTQGTKTTEDNTWVQSIPVKIGHFNATECIYFTCKECPQTQMQGFNQNQLKETRCRSIFK